MQINNPRDSSTNLVSGTQVQTLIRLRGWIPHQLCYTSYGDLQVTMDHEDGKQTKIACYSGSTVTQSIQWDDSTHLVATSVRTETLKSA